MKKKNYALGTKMMKYDSLGDMKRRFNRRILGIMIDGIRDNAYDTCPEQWWWDIVADYFTY